MTEEIFDFEKAFTEMKDCNDDVLQKISTVGNRLQYAESEVNRLEEELKQAKIQHRQIAEEELPLLMQEYGMQDFTLTDGTHIEVKKVYSASIPRDKKEEAFAWLVENNHGDLIKTQVSANFVRGEEEKATIFMKDLEANNYQVSSKKWVEPMTLKAWARNETERGVDVPQNLFGLYIVDKAKITRS